MNINFAKGYTPLCCMQVQHKQFITDNKIKLKGLEFMKTKRFLSVLLALTMIIGMLPIMANAQTAEVLYGESADSLTNSGTLESAFSSSSAKYIKLQSNVTLTDCLYATDTEKTLDLNGYTITAAEDCGAFYIARGVLNLIDTAAETKGKVVSSSNTIELVSEGVLNIGNSTENSGGFTIETTKEYMDAIHANTSSKSINVNKSFTAIGITNAIYNEGTFNGNNIPFDFEGKIFNLGTISQLNATGYAEDNAIHVGGGSLHITGGNYKGKYLYGLYVLGGEVKLEGGTFESEEVLGAIGIVSTYSDLLGEACYYTNGEDDTEITDEEVLASAKKLTVLKEPELEITDIEYNTLKIVFQSNLAGKTATVLFVDYAAWDDPTFRSAKIVPITTVKGENTLVLPSNVYLDAGDKIMIWENLTTIKPLCEAYRVSGRETPVKDTNPGIDLPIDYN